MTDLDGASLWVPCPDCGAARPFSRMRWSVDGRKVIEPHCIPCYLRTRPAVRADDGGQQTIVVIRGATANLSGWWRKRRYGSVPAAIRAMFGGLSVERAHMLLQVLQADLNGRAVRVVRR